MNNNHFPYKGRKLLLFGLCILLIVAILTFNQFVHAAPRFKEQKSTLTNQERELKKISEAKELLKNQKDPTAQWMVENQIKSAELNATMEAIIETRMPTSNIIAKTMIAQSTQTAMNYQGDKKIHPIRPQNSGLTEIPLFVDPKSRYHLTTTWKEPIDEISAEFYSAGLIKDTDQAIIYWLDGKTHYGVIYIASGYTGSLNIIGKQDQFLVLKAKSGADLYFDTITKEFTLSMVGTVTPIPTVVPTFTITPVPPYPAP